MLKKGRRLLSLWSPCIRHRAHVTSSKTEYCTYFWRIYCAQRTFTFSRLRSKFLLFPSLKTAWILWRGILSAFKKAEGNQMGLWKHRHFPNIDGFDFQSLPNVLQNLFQTWLFFPLEVPRVNRSPAILWRKLWFSIILSPRRARLVSKFEPGVLCSV